MRSEIAQREGRAAGDSPRVSYAFNLWNNHYHLSLLYTALAKLSASGAIHLDWRIRDAGELDATSSGGMVPRLLVEQDGQQERVAIDLFDRSDIFDHQTLAWCDRYMKRSCYRPDVETHAAPHAAKVAPFGMNYACRSPGADRLVVRSVVRQAMTLGVRSPLRTLRRTLGERNIYRTYWSLPQAEQLEAPPDAPRKPQVLFQTRVWAPEEVEPDNAEEINTQRAETVRALRQELGERFVGGLVPTPYAREHYPDLLTTASTKRRDFIELVKTSQVLVYTRGLHHSIAFKLPEYLAASGVIVSDPIRNELPEQLVGNTGLAIGASVEELVQRAIRFLRDNRRQEVMRRSSWDFFKKAGYCRGLCQIALDGCPVEPASNRHVGLESNG